MDEPLTVQSRSELARFVAGLAADLETNPAGWENTTLPAFLDALSRYLDDLPGWCRNNAPKVDPEAAQWQLMAVALSGASVYE
ncbi:hypothetical protein J0H58_03815 [bacterium]|nr:hypothetical protein [bacterium]